MTRKPDTTGYGAAGTETTLYTGTAKLLPHILQQHKSKLKVKTKPYEQRPGTGA